METNSGAAGHQTKPKYQCRKLLPFLDSHFKGYEQDTFHQWEVVIKFFIKNAHEKDKTAKIGQKVKNMLVMLDNAHGDSYKMFTEGYKRLQTQTFPKNNNEIRELLKYETTSERYSNVLLIMHVQSIVSYTTFKHKIFQWLKNNGVWFSLSIFRNIKETVLRIGELTMVNPEKIHRIPYQEYLNTVLNDIAEEKDRDDPAYFSTYGTTLNDAKYNVQLQKFHPKIDHNGQKIESVTMAVYAIESHARMAQELMFLATPLTDNSYNFKFVPSYLTTDKTIKDGKKN
eukprot:15366814-Ditylum_brightwellii.AAC.2